MENGHLMKKDFKINCNLELDGKEQHDYTELAAMTTTYQDYLDFLKILNNTKEQ